MIANYIQSKTFVISNSAFDFDVHFSPFGKNHFELSCRIVPNTGLTSLDKLIPSFINKIKGIISENGVGELDDFFDPIAKHISDVISFNNKGITIGETVTINCESYLLAFEKNKNVNTFKLDLEGASFTLKVGGVEIFISGWLEIRFNTNKEFSILFTLDEKSDQLESIEIPNPFPDGKSFALRPCLFTLSFEKMKQKISINGSGKVILSGGPKKIKDYLPNEIDFALSLGNEGARLTIPNVFTNQHLPLKPIPGLDGNSTPLEDLILSVENLSFLIGKASSASIEFSIGIPPGINKYLGTMGLPEFLKTYDPKVNDTEKEMFSCRFSVNSKGIIGELISSPINLNVNNDTVQITELFSKGKHGWRVELGKKGAYGEIELIDFHFSKKTGSTSFSAGGHLKIKKPLALKLDIIKALLNQIKLPILAEALPNKVELKSTKFITDEGKLNLPKEMVSDDVKGLLETIVEKSPDNLKKYFNVSIPDDIKFALSVGASGTIEGEIIFTKKNPIRLLIPTFPAPFGIELRKFSIGNIAMLASASVVIDATIDRFDLVDIVGSSVINGDSKDIVSSLELKELFLLVNYSTGIPIPIPIFYDHICIKNKGLTGIKLESNFKLPKPELDFMQLANQLKGLGEFFTTNDKLLDENAKNKMDLEFTVGANCIELPSYLGGKIIGKKTEVKKISAWKYISKGLNFLKKGSVNDVIESIPLEYRMTPQSATSSKMEINLLDILKIEVQWLLASMNEVDTNKQVQKALGVNDESYKSKSKFLTEVSKKIKRNPNTSTSKTEGALIYLSGSLDITGALSLEAMFGVMVSREALITQFHFHGKLFDLIELELGGFIMLDKGNTIVQGKAELRLFGKQMLYADVDYDKNEKLLKMTGALNLSLGSLISLKGTTAGIISGEDFYFNGKVDLKILKSNAVKADVTINNSEFKFIANLFDIVKLELLLENSGSFTGSIDVDYKTEIYVPVPDEFSSFGLNSFSESIDIKLFGAVNLTEKNNEYTCSIDLSAKISSSTLGELNATTSMKSMPISLSDLKSAIIDEIEEEVKGIVIKGFNEAKDQFNEVAKRVGELVDDIDKQLGISEKANDAYNEANKLFNDFTSSLDSLLNSAGDTLDWAYSKIRGSKTAKEKEYQRKIEEQKGLKEYNNRIRVEALREKEKKEQQLDKLKQKLLNLSGMKHTYLRAKVKGAGELWNNNSFVSTEAGERKKTHKWGHSYPNLVNFSANDKSYITGQSLGGKHFWIYEMEDDGELGKQAYSQTNWDKKADTIVVFHFNGKTYLLGLSKSDNRLFIREVLNNGKLAKQDAYATTWNYYYKQLVTFSVKGRVFISGQNEQGLFTREVLQKYDRIEMSEIKEYCYHVTDTLRFARLTFLEKEVSLTVINTRDKAFLWVDSKLQKMRYVYTIESDGRLSLYSYANTGGKYYPNLFSFKKNGSTFVAGQSEDGKRFFIGYVHNDQGLLTWSPTELDNKFTYSLKNLLPVQVGDDIFICGQVDSIVLKK